MERGLTRTTVPDKLHPNLNPKIYRDINPGYFQKGRTTTTVPDELYHLGLSRVNFASGSSAVALLPPRHDEKERVRKPADALAAMRNQVLLRELGEVDLMNFSLKPVLNHSLYPMRGQVQTWALVEVDLQITSHQNVLSY